ncbi:TRAP transporter substrate-binding protein [Anaeromicrobium sediminis]|uniref:C4-dicarboxylate ABC transporter substrate-binding protein n=1 Tax=Anaeromicrobium sediminis TaxID=1478221 RepID=A0A267MQ54_9FIRM|nr:TRAP transporter substrate-binding protein [Anaeromicrobium sediminis]PAB61035.1 hypothetical protein CCE28_00975 [Anaeromicrobium sediminis]
MKKILSVLLMITLIASLMVGCQSKEKNNEESKETVSEQNAEEKVYTFKFANQKNEQHPRTVSMMWFKDELEKRTSGKIKVEIYHSGVLGKEQELFQMTVTGALQGYRGAGYEQLSDKFSLWNVPFLFQSYDEISYFEQSDFANQIMKDASKNGIYIPAVGFTGFRNMMNMKKKIEHPSDLKGLKMRAPGQAPIINFYKEVGAHPQEMNFSDVYMALKTGVVDGVCSSASDLETNKIYEVAKHFTWNNYMAGADPFMVNMKWYESLPNDLKRIFDEVSIETMVYSDKLLSEQENEFANKLQGVVDDTVQVLEDPELTKEWVEASKPLWKGFVEEGLFTQEDIDKVEEILEEYRKNN